MQSSNECPSPTSDAFDFDSKRTMQEVGDDEDFSGGRLSCWQKLRFFVKQSCKDIYRHKCQFCLSFCSVFVVVLSLLTVVSITQKGPIIFLRLSEKQVGMFDGIFSSRHYGTDEQAFMGASEFFLNY